nr:whey acidic protein-like [Paramormyrops kingsleyae]
MRVFLAAIVMAKLLIVFGSRCEKPCPVCRAGACPTNGGKLPSTSSCTCDCDCPGKLKCCAYGTIRTCVQSTSGYPGLCPVITTSATTCKVDGDCSKGWKCYSSGCGNLCVPTAGKRDD